MIIKYCVQTKCEHHTLEKQNHEGRSWCEDEGCLAKHSTCLDRVGRKLLIKGEIGEQKKVSSLDMYPKSGIDF
jgi:hypothetical protein